MMNPSSDDSPPEFIHGSEGNFRPEIEFLEGAEVLPDVSCWRCHKAYPENLLECMHCGAKNKTAAAQIHFPSSAGRKASPIKIVLVTYGILLMGSLILAAVVRLGMDPESGEGAGFAGPILVLEIVDTIIVLIAMGMSGLAFARIEPVPKIPAATVAWFLFVPGLALMLLINKTYHEMLLEILKIPQAESIYSDSWPVLLLLYCVQPAIVEELFARQMSLAVLRKIGSSLIFVGDA